MCHRSYLLHSASRIVEASVDGPVGIGLPVDPVVVGGVGANARQPELQKDSGAAFRDYGSPFVGPGTVLAGPTGRKDKELASLRAFHCKRDRESA